MSTSPKPASVHALVEQSVLTACLRVAPQWALDELVAVNPFTGQVDDSITVVDARLRRCVGDGVLPGPAALADAWKAQRFDLEDLRAAASACGLDEAQVQQTAAQLAAPDTAPVVQGQRVQGIAERFQAAGLGPWPQHLIDHVASFLAAQAHAGVSRFPVAGGVGPWAGWLAYVRHDRALAAWGLPGFSAWAATIPTEPKAARAWLLGQLHVAEAEVQDYAQHLLGGIQGWAGALRRSTWLSGGIDAVADLLTIRLACEAGLAALHPRASAALQSPLIPTAVAASPAAMLPMVAAEIGYRRRSLLPLIESSRVAVPVTERPAAQMVFCIDVRSEPMRRAIEAADPGILTVGFAGFFGVAATLEQGSGTRAQCPVLLTPQHRVGLAVQQPPRFIGKLLGHLRRAAGGGFAYMETAGFASAAPLISETLGLGRTVHLGDADACNDPEHAAPIDLSSISAENLVALATTILTHVPLEGPPARLLVLCGHDSSTANNPQAGGLACGACGGHGGGSNARAAAAILNHPQVRAAIPAIPTDTVAVAAIHDTARDRVILLDRALVPASHHPDLERFERAVTAAGATAGARRAATLPGLAAGDAEVALDQRVRDWAEPRTEWALAGCAAFIAAPRAWTKNLDLGGRVFLNSYDPAADASGATLELILTAPVVVASWISWQYHASVSCPTRFSSGCKTIHNPVGGVGIIQGNRGDLAVGPATQSVHDGHESRHDPVRLAVVIAAAPEAIDAVLARHPGVGALFNHGWLGLSALAPGRLQRRLGPGQWIDG